MWRALTYTLLPDDVLQLVLGYWGNLHSLAFLERKQDPYHWFLALCDEMPGNSGYVLSVLQNFHSRVQQFLLEYLKTMHSPLHPIQALLASSFLLHTLNWQNSLLGWLCQITNSSGNRSDGNRVHHKPA